ncbi:MAG: hypothetical protein E7647_01980 [Ruminococcaceae bacterium]|nr:hypothetical protein [Oscillospiraceae bacterium]
MNKIKSILALLLCAAMLLVLCACGSEKAPADETGNDTTVADTTANDTTEAPKATSLVVKFVDEEGNNVLGGSAQFCNSANCYFPAPELDGSCIFLEEWFEKVEAGDYLTIYAPTGYEVKEPALDEENKIYLAGGETEVVITLTKVG